MADSFLHADIEREFKRWQGLVGEDDPYAHPECIGIHDVLRAHFLIADFFVEGDNPIGGVGPKSVDLLHSAIYRQFVSFGAKDKWTTPLEKCATLLFGLVKDHPFHDANKRTALLVCLFHLEKLKRTPTATHRELEDFVVDVADNRLTKYARFRDSKDERGEPEVAFIADFLRRNSRRIEREEHVVTFHHLQGLLQRHGYALVNPKGNYIDVARVEMRPKFLGIVGPKIRKDTRLAQIGFPGWKRQVGRSALTTVREATGLTQKNGYDSAVFFGNADPLDSLIAKYAEPLKRLAFR